jgi:hypothetical protein
MTFHNHEKVLKNYGSVICKTLKWTNIIKMKEMNWCEMCMSMCVWLFDHGRLMSNAF